MAGIIHRLAIIGASASAPLVLVTLISPGVSNATECGWGTVFDPPSNTCVAAPLPPPPPPPAWNGDITPGFGVSVCVPIPVPFAPSVCTGI
jgi:hypothetical protein